MFPQSLIAIFVMLLATHAMVLAQGNTVAKSGYVAVHGLKMYYRIQGADRPLVLLHGALSNIDTDFGKMLPELAKQRQVIAQSSNRHTVIPPTLTDHLPMRRWLKTRLSCFDN